MAEGGDVESGTGAGGPEGRLLRTGPLGVLVTDGALRVFWSGTEVLRGIAWPVRDADWRTLEEIATGAESHAGGDGVRHERRFVTAGGAVAGVLSVAGSADASGGELTASVAFEPERDVEVNRAGFVLLHPAALAGAPLEIAHSDGATEARCLSRQDQRGPARLRHRGSAPRSARRRRRDRLRGRGLRDGGPAQLDRRLVQDVFSPAVPSAPIPARPRRDGPPDHPPEAPRGRDARGGEDAGGGSRDAR